MATPFEQMKLRRSCKEVTRLVLQSEDRRLTLVERAALQFHWMVCTNCVRFKGQAELMRTAVDRWRQYRDGQ
jgi:hypothetical protein